MVGVAPFSGSQSLFVAFDGKDANADVAVSSRGGWLWRAHPSSSSCSGGSCCRSFLAPLPSSKFRVNGKVFCKITNWVVRLPSANLYEPRCERRHNEGSHVPSQRLGVSFQKRGLLSLDLFYSILF